MLAFSSIVVSSQGDHVFMAGTLFSLPPELCDNHRILQYLKIKETGWTKSEFGYMAFVKVDEQGKRYILPGLWLVDGTPPTKKIHGYKAQFTKEQVELYLDHHLERMSDVRSSSEGELTALVHDLRHLSSSIYHSALEAEGAKSLNEIRDKIRTIIASQTMLKVRIDYLDFSSAVDRFDEIEKIPVYGRVDKVIRCFGADARHKALEISLVGRSFRLAEGPNILDIVPYTLIENAIKYSPPGSNITVEVNDTETTTEVSVRSLGPLLEKDDTTRIFEKGFRGKSAVLLRPSGTGLGLSVARDVIENFKGCISVVQSTTTEVVADVPYAETTFHFNIPTSGENSRLRKKAEMLSRRRSRRRATPLP